MSLKPINPTLYPLRPTAARDLARLIAETGVADFSHHALDEMKKDGLETTDCLNLLRAGSFEEPEYEKGEYRYRACTRRMCIVIVFLSDSRLRFITAWRNKL